MKFKCKDEYITLGQLLKACGVVSNGGEIKAYLANETVLLNGEKENRRGKKIYPKDVVEVEDLRIEIE